MSDFHPLLSMAMVLSAGLIGGELVARFKIPKVTGWIITGIVLRAVGVPGLEPERLGDFKPFTDFVLGYIAFTVGSHLNFRSLTNAGKRLVLLVLTEATITPTIVLLAMWGIAGLSLEISLLFAAIAIAGAPGTTVIVVRELNARGVFVKTLVAAVALIDMVCVCFYVLIDTEMRGGMPLEDLSFLITAAPYALKSLGVALAIGLGLSLVVMGLTRTLVGPKSLGSVLVAAMLAAWGLAHLLGASSILASTFTGVALANLMPEQEHAGEAYLGTFAGVLFTAFYTLAGVRLDFSQVLPMAGLVFLFFGARLVGKSLSAFTAMSLAKMTRNVRNYLGMALMPHGGVAVGLIVAIQTIPEYQPFADTLLAVGLSALAINQLIGPSMTKFALQRAGEAGMDRPRLLDFIREQDIVVNFTPKDKVDAIRQLADVLYRTHDVHVDKETFVQSTLKRDAEESTCLGEGLMLPHGMIAAGDEIVGVLGLNRKGLPFETPDGRPVHAVILLATPVNQRERHLEILAAFAHAVTSDRNIRDQLYHVDTAAHAYELLHANDANDFNYFLDDVMLDDLT